MKRFILGLLAVLAFGVSFANAQGSNQSICFTTNGVNCVPVSPSNPFPTSDAPSVSANIALDQTICGSAVSSCVIKASAGNFYGVYANCTSACWVMLFNRTTAPTNGATTAGTASGNMTDCFEVAAGSSKSLFYAPMPINFSVGIVAVISSTACASLTLSTVGFVKGVYK